MSKDLFLLLCFTGIFPPAVSITRQFHLIDLPKTWNDAQTYCRTTYIDLAVFETAAEMTDLQAVAQSSMFTSDAWVGLYNDMNSWRWSLNNEPLGTMIMWDTADYQPNNRDGHQECSSITSHGWYDETCSDLFPFICYDASLTGKDRYIYYTNDVTWPEAQSYCRLHHTDLASSRDNTEYQDIQSKIDTYVYFGLFRDSWKWVDASVFTTVPWDTFQPDNYYGDENCGYLYDGLVSDEQCTELKSFFCYSEAVVVSTVTIPVSTVASTMAAVIKKQIVGLKVQSTQDVNDPVVNAVILQQIKQKLQAHGLIITIQWRKQPNGVVFNKVKKQSTITPETMHLCKAQNV